MSVKVGQARGREFVTLPHGRGSLAAIALVAIGTLGAQTVTGPWSDRAYRADLDTFISDGQYAAAENAARREIGKAGAGTIGMALALDMLTEVYFYGDRVRDPAAEESALQAIAIKQQVLGADNPQVAVSLRLMGHLLDAKGDYERARNPELVPTAASA